MKFSLGIYVKLEPLPTIKPFTGGVVISYSSDSDSISDPEIVTNTGLSSKVLTEPAFATGLMLTSSTVTLIIDAASCNPSFATSSKLYSPGPCPSVGVQYILDASVFNETPSG